MTQFDGQDGVFEVSSSPDSLIADPVFEGANVCRAAALSSLLGAPKSISAPLGPELTELGFSSTVVQDERDWRDSNPFAGLEDAAVPWDDDMNEARIRRWRALNETADPRDAVALLIAILGSPLERESVAAAAALWRRLQLPGVLPQRQAPRRWFFYERLFDIWDDDLLNPDWLRVLPSLPDEYEQPADEDVTYLNVDRWQELFRRIASRLSGNRYDDPLLIAVLVRRRLDQAVRSPDPVVRSLAMAAFQPSEPSSDVPIEPPLTPLVTPPGALVVSTMIHGTWAWKGDWWRPKGSGFHDYILRNHRPNLFSRGARFSWSGRLRAGDRAVAAKDFCDWAYDVAPNGLQTVFGHSYGGEVAARALLAGAKIHELVLLSTPVTNHVRSAIHVAARIVDVRLRFDPVLAIACQGQHLPPHPNVTAVPLAGWRLQHGATHEEPVWRAENVAYRAQL